MSYPETLSLQDKEVVLTFDDGPERPNTSDVLDILASECVRATFFIVGRMAKIHPELVRRAVDEGHTVGTHTMNHPLHFRALAVDRARQEIEGGIEATSAALGDPTRLAPFFRFPGFGRTEAAEEYLASRGLMVWSADFPADDWRKIGPEEVARRALTRLESHGKGILLLHDIHKRTVEALPIILQALKAGGYHVVHVLPAAPEHPMTPTTDDQWRLHRELKPDSSAAVQTKVGGTVIQ
jgi:peptidoglycan/xylan/chitin deacetylase (PgdA/CDA1 family)